MRDNSKALLLLLVGVPLFLVSCVHTKCPSGTACVAALGPPKWIEHAICEGETQRSVAAYRASLTPLHRAIGAGDVATVEHILQGAPEQALVKTRNEETALALAVTAPYPDPRIVALLLAAGAEGFVPAQGEYAFETPFGLAIRHGSAELVEAFLRTGKLDPVSVEAAEYLEYAGRAAWAVERMLSYGVPLQGAPGILPELVGRGSLDTMREVLALAPRIDDDAWREASFDALRLAVRNCNVEMAEPLLERYGAGLSADAATSLVHELGDRCVLGGSVDPVPTQRAHERNALAGFMRKLVAAGADLSKVADPVQADPARRAGIAAQFEASGQTDDQDRGPSTRPNADVTRAGR